MSPPENPSTVESERIHENQRSAEEGARHPEPEGGDVEHDSPQGPPPRAEPVEDAPNSEGDRGMDGFQ